MAEEISLEEYKKAYSRRKRNDCPSIARSLWNGPCRMYSRSASILPSSCSYSPWKLTVVVSL